jgi:hypothetical protein
MIEVVGKDPLGLEKYMFRGLVISGSLVHLVHLSTPPPEDEEETASEEEG